MPLRRREPWPSPGLRDELRQPHQIVGGSREGEGPADAVAASEPGLSLPADRLDPAERLLDALPDALAHRVATVSRRAAINGRTAATCVLRDVRRHPHRA